MTVLWGKFKFFVKNILKSFNFKYHSLDTFHIFYWIFHNLHHANHWTMIILTHNAIFIQLNFTISLFALTCTPSSHTCIQRKSFCREICARQHKRNGMHFKNWKHMVSQWSCSTLFSSLSFCRFFKLKKSVNQYACKHNTTFCAGENATAVPCYSDWITLSIEWIELWAWKGFKFNFYGFQTRKCLYHVSQWNFYVYWSIAKFDCGSIYSRAWRSLFSGGDRECFI